jgi:hypothetical protein
MQRRATLDVLETIHINASYPVSGLIVKLKESQYLGMIILRCRMEEGDT